ncbi:hypothetical protein SDC9_166362 [bioreactor metagenome]|uniref:Uncharacterized protein n=1 Tax=bioreactor metagenome TaxID=1076179 RepID=A0A645FYK8_9ZZZZ
MLLRVDGRVVPMKRSTERRPTGQQVCFRPRSLIAIEIQSNKNGRRESNILGTIKQQVKIENTIIIHLAENTTFLTYRHSVKSIIFLRKQHGFNGIRRRRHLAIQTIFECLQHFATLDLPCFQGIRQWGKCISA